MRATVITVYLLFSIIWFMSHLHHGIAKLLEGGVGSGIPSKPVICPSVEVPEAG